ncbi:hypothetical protein STRIP9103_06441 [Streptomyces ipomoeae 91-03]|uniref:Uncharacterized protein n=1 Tax=Streptomyces ipomoeae 91-03 TaxID=698759 RepID=L1KU57_9ACTN|nr:hypothetical protein STRIP9103_06441 [Streptomyces ipomoeae 91-03]
MNESFALPHRDPSFLGRSELVDELLPGFWTGQTTAYRLYSTGEWASGKQW